MALAVSNTGLGDRYGAPKARVLTEQVPGTWLRNVATSEACRTVILQTVAESRTRMERNSLDTWRESVRRQAMNNLSRHWGIVLVLLALLAGGCGRATGTSTRTAF